MIEISPEFSLNPAFIVSIKLSSYRDAVYIRMSDGKEHRIDPDHGETAMDTYDRLLKEITDANSTTDTLLNRPGTGAPSR